MKQVYRLTALLGLTLLSACGGSGDDSSSSTASHNFSAGGANVVPMTVAPGPASSNYQTFNIPLVTVTVCEPGTSTCATIPNVLVDTGSFGLRIMASLLTAAGVNLPAMMDPSNSNNTIQECLPFADGYAWGAVSKATVTIGGETTSGSIPIQVINDSTNPSPAAPSGCTESGGLVSLDSVNAFDANGVLGVGVFDQDCGSACVSDANNDVYWTCTTAPSCNSTTLALTDQVADPVASFPTDNNGVIVQLSSISASGAATAGGYLVFGIDTESNNALGGATVLTANDEGNFTTTFDGGSPSSLPSSFIDSGSNALYFNDSSLEGSPCGTGQSAAAQFYCPSSTTSLTATNQGDNGTTSDTSFQVADLNNISNSNFAIDDVAGTAPTIPSFGPYFDWGLPFFYGRTVFVAIEGVSAGGTEGPYYAY